jgi:hypothetical protein
MARYQQLITSLLVLGFLGLLYLVAQRGRPKLDAETGVVWFRHSAIFRGFALLIGLGVPLAITALIVFKPPKNRADVLAIIGLFGLFGLLGGPLLWEAIRFALGVSKDGLDCRSPWRPGRFVPWNRVEKLSYSTMNSWFVIHTKDRWSFHVSIFVPGLSVFLIRCEQHLSIANLVKAKPGYSQVGRPFPTVERTGRASRRPESDV